MADSARKMTVDAFLDWCTRQEDERYEFVDGMPVLMVGATDQHDQIVVNLIGELRARLKGTPCAPRTADQAVKTKSDQRVRRPDVLVDCGPRPPKGLYSQTPTVVFEVLSPSTENVTFSSKLDEYKGIASMRHVVLLDQNKPFLLHYARAANDSWTEMELAGVEAVLELDAIGVMLPLSEIYADVSFEAAPDED
ncbi:MAG: Uma2 family endonuclease [Terricaulis sp.]